MQTSFIKKLELGAAALSLSLTEDQAKQFQTYYELLLKWNKTHNLTAITQEDEVLTKHFLDSLSIAPYLLNGNTIADVGTGAGFPGIPLAIYFPHKTFYLIESIGKKASFLQQAVHRLALTNVKILHERVENVSALKVDVIITRAFSSLKNMVTLTQHLGSPNVKFFAMKGAVSEEELEALGQGFTITLQKLVIPGLDARRYLVILEGVSECG